MPKSSSSCSPGMVVGVVVVALIIIVLMFAFRRPAQTMTYGAMSSLNQNAKPLKASGAAIWSKTYKGNVVPTKALQKLEFTASLPKDNTLCCTEAYTTKERAIEVCKSSPTCMMVNEAVIPMSSTKRYHVCRTQPQCPVPSCPKCPACPTPQPQITPQPQDNLKVVVKPCAYYADGGPLYCIDTIPKGSTICSFSKEDGLPILCEKTPANPQDLPNCGYYADGSPVYCNGTLPVGSTPCGIAPNGSNILCQYPSV